MRGSQNWRQLEKAESLRGLSKTLSASRRQLLWKGKQEERKGPGCSLAGVCLHG